MKKIVFALITAAAMSYSIAADVGVSINIAQPGVYGRIDIGSVPGPQVVYERPVVIYAPPVGVVREPLYLYVPPGHQKHWSKHCASYNACGQPVYFVQERWYQEVYLPKYRDQGRDRRDYKDRGRDDDRDDDRGRGKHHGKGHKDD